MAIKSKEDLRNLVRVEGAVYGDRQNPQFSNVGVELSVDGYKGSIWLPQKKEYYHVFNAYDQYGMAKSIAIFDSVLKGKFGTTLEKLGITMEIKTLEGFKR